MAGFPVNLPPFAASVIVNYIGEYYYLFRTADLQSPPRCKSGRATPTIPHKLVLKFCYEYNADGIRLFSVVFPSFSKVFAVRNASNSGWSSGDIIDSSWKFVVDRLKTRSFVPGHVMRTSDNTDFVENKLFFFPILNGSLLFRSSLKSVVKTDLMFKE